MGHIFQDVSPRRRVAGLVIFVAVAIVIIVLSNGSVRVYQVSSSSMIRTLQVGDFVVVDGRKPIDPQRGEIVAVRNPKDRNEYLCKRLVGRPGDVVEIIDGRLYLNSVLQIEDYVMHPRFQVDTPKRFVLGDKQYFVMGDNRALSFDSVDFGPVSQSDLLGIVRGIYWPRSHAHTFQRPSS